MRSFRTSRNGFTLIEVLIVSVIALIATLGVMSCLYFVNGAQKYARERAGAQRVAATLLEKARHTSFDSLVEEHNINVTIDDMGTPVDPKDPTTANNDADDLKGESDLKLYVPNPDPSQPPTEITKADGQNYVIVEATVSWYSAGNRRLASQLRQVTLVTQLAP